jgi:hypothetical protein
MVPTYSDYIRRYIHRKSTSSPPSPGEHHFVATYLLPKLYEINGLIPDYVNPDGMKSIIGDVVYYQDEQHHFGIEVKLGTVRLTRREFNDWIVSEDPTGWPSLFLGVGRKGIALSTWSDFRTSYTASVVAKNPGWVASVIRDGYGPMKGVDELAEYLGKSQWFAIAEAAAATESELLFTTALRSRIEA